MWLDSLGRAILELGWAHASAISCFSGLEEDIVAVLDRIGRDVCGVNNSRCQVERRWKDGWRVGFRWSKLCPREGKRIQW